MALTAALLASVVLGAGPEKPLANVLRDLQSPEWTMRVHALDDLAPWVARGGVEGGRAARALLKRADDPHPRVRGAVTFHLGRLPELARENAHVLVRLLERDPDDRVRGGAARAILEADVRTSAAVEAMRRAVVHPSSTVSANAIEYVARVDPDPVALIAMALDVTAGFPESEWPAAETAARMLHRAGDRAGDRAGAAVPALRRAALRHRDGVLMIVSLQAARALQKVSGDPGDLEIALQVLTAGVKKGRSEWLWGLAVEGLCEMGPRAAPAVEALEELRRHHLDQYSQQEIDNALARIHGDVQRSCR